MRLRESTYEVRLTATSKYEAHTSKMDIALLEVQWSICSPAWLVMGLASASAAKTLPTSPEYGNKDLDQKHLA